MPWGVPGFRAEAGSRPGGRGTFLCFAKETYPKERRPCWLRPPRGARGQPGAEHLRGAPWNSLRACGAALRQPRRVSLRSGDVSCGTSPPPRKHSAPGASRRAGAAQQPEHPHGPSLRSALHAQRRALAPAHRGPSAAMARMDVRLRVPFRMRRGAQVLADEGSRLFECREAARV